MNYFARKWKKHLTWFFLQMCGIYCIETKGCTNGWLPHRMAQWGRPRLKLSIEHQIVIAT